jgi:hypothetical protein
MLPRRRWRRVRLRAGAVVAAIAAIALGLSALAVARNWTPSVPTDAGSTLVATTSLSDAAPGDAMADGCPDDVTAPAGRIHLCWEAWREAADDDPDQDYYRLRVHGTFGGPVGSGVRWVVLRAKLLDRPSNDVFETWPDGVIEGGCRPEPVDLTLSKGFDETVCGRTTATSDGSDWTQTVAWTCVGCLVPDHDDRAIALDQFVAVPSDTVPRWEIDTHLGS